MRDGESALGSHAGRQRRANPMTYLGRDDKQYVATVAGERLVSFALP